MGTRVKQNPETTFEVYAEVTYPVTTGTDPEVRRQFPEDYSDQEILQTLTKFCFPFYVDSITVGQVGQNFTFVLTDIDSKQRFGFCRLSSGAKTCFCILRFHYGLPVHLAKESHHQLQVAALGKVVKGRSQECGLAHISSELNSVPETPHPQAPHPHRYEHHYEHHFTSDTITGCTDGGTG